MEDPSAIAFYLDTELHNTIFNLIINPNKSRKLQTTSEVFHSLFYIQYTVHMNMYMVHANTIVTLIQYAIYKHL